MASTPACYDFSMATHRQNLLATSPPEAGPDTEASASGPARRRSRQRFLPIAVKLTLVLGGLMVGGILLLGLLTIDNQRRLMQQQLDEFGLSIARLLADSAREPLLAEDELVLETVVSKFGNTRSSLGAVVYNDRGQPVASRGVVPEGKLTELYHRARPLTDIDYSLEWRWVHRNGASESMVSYLTPIRYRNLVAGHALVTFSRRIIEEQFHESLMILLGAMLLMLIASLLLAWYLSRWLARPIHQLVRASQAIGAGDYGYRMDDRRNDELGILMRSFNDMAHGLLRKSQVEQALSRYVSQDVASEILRNLDQIELGGRHVEASVVFADIVGFTKMSERLEPREISDLLNRYFHYITRASALWQGTIDKFIGDCAMIVFGVPRSDPEHRFHAVACAVLIRRVVTRLNAQREAQGQQPIHFRIGINCGQMLAGNMGSRDRMQYTVVGDAVNLASRLATQAEADEILIDEEMYRHAEVSGRVIAEPHGTIPIRGRREPATLYRIIDLSPDYRQQLEAMVDRVLEAED